MRIGLVVDGVTEFASLPVLYDQVYDATGNRLLTPVRAKIPPYAPLPVIARSCAKEVVQLFGRGAERVVVLVDREQRPECCGNLAAGIRGGLAGLCGQAPAVVVKNRTFENWVVADVAAVRAGRNRFSVSNAMESAVRGTADNVEALELLRRAAQGDAYEKVHDAKRILERAELARLASNSRSFRRFLRVLEHPDYLDQSARPRP